MMARAQAGEFPVPDKDGKALEPARISRGRIEEIVTVLLEKFAQSGPLAA